MKQSTNLYILLNHCLGMSSSQKSLFPFDDAKLGSYSSSHNYFSLYLDKMALLLT